MKLKSCGLPSVLLLVVFVLSAVKLAGATSTLSPTFTISNVSGKMAYDSGTGEVFVQHGIDYATVSVISDSTNHFVANVTTVEAYGFNGGLVYDSGKGEVFAASGDAHSGGAGTPTITAVSDGNNTVVATITYSTFGNSAYNFPYEPTRMAYDSGKGEIFIVDPGSSGYAFGNVYVMSDSSNTVGASVQVGHSPGELVYDSGMGEIFVANAGSNTVSVIADNNNSVIATINVGSSPCGLAYDSSKSEVFVYNEGDGTVSVISDSTNAVVANVTGIAANYATYTIAYDSGNGMIFAGNAVISDNTNTISAMLPAGLGDMVYDSGKGEIFATSNSGNTVVFSNSSIPEYGSIGLFTGAAIITTMTACAIAIARRKSKQTRL
jgi:YVTN family beta-propeller protein